MAPWTRVAGLSLASCLSLSTTAYAQAVQASWDPSATTLNVYLFEDGGMIKVTVGDAKDAASVTAVRSRLAAVASEFAEGDFSTPEFGIGDDLPGTADLKRAGERVAYVQSDMTNGALLRLTTRFARARSAIHEFLRHVITANKTGDSLEVTRPPG
jgi:hypothetical protein